MTASPATVGELVIRRAEPVMGTVVSFDIRPQGLSGMQARKALREACEVLHRADATFSLYRPDSPLSRLRRGELRPQERSDELTQITALCARARELSGGWFDPWAMPGGFDPTGLVKGWAAEQACAVLARAGVGAAMVNAAGDVSLHGRPSPDRPWQIGIRCPSDVRRLIAVVAPDGSVATSGQYERGPHVLNPRTGRPADAARSATVCGPHLQLADALATGLLAAGREGMADVRAAGYEGLVVMADGTTCQSNGFPVVG